MFSNFLQYILRINRHVIFSKSKDEVILVQ